MPPIVSVILPTYNRVHLLPASIASVTDQTLEHLELIVVDDGSIDDMESAFPKDVRIRFIRLAHSGNLAIVRNAGLSLATGDYVGFLDSDDLWPATKLERQVAALETQSESGWCYGRHQLIDERGEAFPLRSSFPWVPRRGAFLSEMLTTEAGVALQTVLVRRTLAHRVAFDTRLPIGDDYDFLIRLAMAAPACVIDACLADIREHAGRATRTRYEINLYLALAYRRYHQQVRDRALKRVCRARARSLWRHYWARARLAGETRSAFQLALRTWLLQR